MEAWQSKPIFHLQGHIRAYEQRASQDSGIGLWGKRLAFLVSHSAGFGHGEPR